MDEYSYKRIDIDRLLSLVSTQDVGEKYADKIRNSGKYAFIICPFHNDTSLGSCWINKEINYFKCEACGEHGNALKLFSGFQGLDIKLNFSELLERFVKEFSIKRETVLVDYTGSSEIDWVNDNSEDDYIRLLGQLVISYPIKFSTILLGNENIQYPSEYSKINLMKLYREDKIAHDYVVCVIARKNWITWMKMQLASNDNSIQALSLCDDLNKMKPCKLHLLLKSNLINDEYSISILTKTHPKIDCSTLSSYYDAILKNESQVLKRLLHSCNYEEETKLRTQLMENEKIKRSVVAKCRLKQQTLKEIL